MPNVLITGMSGTGKTTVLEQLRSRGCETVDTDADGWCEWGTLPGEADAGWLWREDPMRELLARPRSVPLFVGGCVANQGKFYPQFDHIVLLSAPWEVMRERLRQRTGNPYGKSDAEQAEILHHLREVEPLLRAGADVELDSSRHTVDELVGALLALDTVG
ncbi:hypothetical protein Dcar01_00637 [Deinococcus carri]|uniref:Shikimate kinase n=1 Tax=Deinococcus carri TaxID=1211323 RepID=A0ABP9W5Y0_9DEIO